ncbi:iron complex outermembrane receptor protein [Rhizomicrobium palustre]|uniref:Iron complex outermembrane receptor protein n=1 Tax=Rhizomicrobium palustre TaxID=189966 RepID=A0A846MZY4_9PROT|nr:TonB-dependent receptor [Rhizomicrobium palustre]NIK88572.1 iron complex outermembrane receptor protein [Rhizomicrobium palustre]
MLERRIAARLMARASTFALCGAVFATVAVAADVADTIGGGVGTGTETIVVTGTKFNAEAAPAKASINTTEPQTIITKSYIENLTNPSADYVTVLAIAPSLTGLDVNGPGLSDGNVKNTLRGMPDGNFGMTYDGIPFGDTNGPTHHSASYFPGTTIGSINVERGPGNAGNLGASTWGGSINMYSEVLNPDMGVKASASRGSWNTSTLDLNFQSGDISGLGKTRILADFSGVQTEGYLTNQSMMKDNELLKLESEFAPGWTLTLFANRNNLHQHVSDKNGATAAQIVTYGKQYSLQKNDPTAPDYYGYNYADKITDMDYVRLRGAVTDWLSIDDQAYTYAYVNKTVTTTSTQQTFSGNALAWKTIGTSLIDPNTSKVTKFANDLPGYTKLNAYRVWGNVFRASADFTAGPVTGQIRAGVWWEGQATERQRYYFDVTKCAAANCSPFHQAWLYADASNKSASTDPSLYQGRYGVGYLEHTGWNQIEPFVEVELHPIENLTITPGFKYIDWNHTVDPNSVISGTTTTATTGCAGNKCQGPAFYNGTVTSFTTSRPLYFATANYKIEPNWSTYFQFATGIYVPDISVFEQQKPNTFPAAMTTVNYQFGTVYYADNFSIDADVYYIAAKHNYTYSNCVSDPSQQCATDTGDATYKGIEGEATYNLSDLGFDGVTIFSNGSLNSAKSGFAQLKNAPYWTAAAGLIYDLGDIRFSLIDKTVGQQYMDNASANGTRTLGADGQPFYRLPAYSTLNFTTAYKFAEHFEVSVSVNNLLDDRSLVSTSGTDGKDSTGVGAAMSVSDYMHRPTSTDQYYFQSSRSFQVSLKAKI